MDSSMVLGLAAVLITVMSGLGLAWYLFVAPKASGDVGALRGRSVENDPRSEKAGGRNRNEPSAEALEELKRKRRKKLKKAEVLNLEDKFFQAGMFSQESRREFFLMKTFAPVVLAPIAGLIGAHNGVLMGLTGALLGAGVGIRIPNMLLDRKIAQRHEDIMFFLPLVIEQIVIGVSSSLDIGPCMQRVVSMADERDTHNCVTELLAVAQHYTSSGISIIANYFI